MNRFLLPLLLLFTVTFTVASAQNQPAENSQSGSKFTIGGYGQIDFNQPFEKGLRRNGTLDIHRFVFTAGYQFNDRASLMSEIEIEHVNEVYVEQAYLNYRILPWLNFRGGLMLIPMGFINENHEPPVFNGVERPNTDNKIVPTTWREIGAGFAGSFPSASVRYQIYLVNGFNGYSGSGMLTGADGLRKGRQKGISSYISSPNLSAKIEYYGVKGLKLGLSGYFGDTQSTLYNRLDKSNSVAVAKADSSVVGINMIGLDGRYEIGAFEFRGQYIYTSLSNTVAYNKFTKKDVGSAMTGWYLEAGYNVFAHTSFDSKLVPFVRYEEYDTQHAVAGNTNRNLANNVREITAGLGWKPTSKLALKADYQWINPGGSAVSTGMFNAGIGFMF